MNNFAKLFKLIEITRSQPQYGYALAGIKKDDLSDLAQHHYLVTFIAWQLGVDLISKGAKLNLAKILEFALVHDLGELFGGDIAMPYAKANPKARELAKAFEDENHNFLSNFFGTQKDYFRELSREVMDAKSDESIIAKVADYIEVTHYKQYVGKISKGDIIMAYNGMVKKIEKVNDLITRTELQKIVEEWKTEMEKLENGEFFELAKQ